MIELPKPAREPYINDDIERRKKPYFVNLNNSTPTISFPNSKEVRDAYNSISFPFGLEITTDHSQDPRTVYFRSRYKNPQKTMAVYIGGEGMIVTGGARIVVDPGVRFFFAPRGFYQTRSGGAGMALSGAYLTVKGGSAPQDRVWFTSANYYIPGKTPMNGDWGGISIDWTGGGEDGLAANIKKGASGMSIVNYAIVEFANLKGLEQFYSYSEISDSIFRYTNGDCVYSEYSTFDFKRCLLYGNGFHEFVLEQFNDGVLIDKCFFHSGEFAINVMDSNNVTIRGCRFTKYDTANVNRLPDFHYISLVNSTEVKIDNNQFEDSRRLRNASAVKEYVELHGDNEWEPRNNELLAPEEPNMSIADDAVEDFLGYKDQVWQKLGYLPGDPAKDQFPYIYDSVDYTRIWTERLGYNFGMSLYLAWANSSLWLGSQFGFIQFNPINKQVLKYEAIGESYRMQSLGFDGKTFWAVCDAPQLLIVWFKPVRYQSKWPNVQVREHDGFIKVLGTFTIPDGYSHEGIACDPKKREIYLVDKTPDASGFRRIVRYGLPNNGVPPPQPSTAAPSSYFEQAKNKREEILVTHKGAFETTFCWNGSGFWAPGEGYQWVPKSKTLPGQSPFPTQWELVPGGERNMLRYGFQQWFSSRVLLVEGSIFPISAETLDLAWDGQYLWTEVKGCETRKVGHLFKVAVINDGPPRELRKPLLLPQQWDRARTSAEQHLQQRGQPMFNPVTHPNLADVSGVPAVPLARSNPADFQ